MSTRIESGARHLTREPDFLVSALSYLDQIYFPKEASGKIVFTECDDNEQEKRT